MILPLSILYWAVSIYSYTIQTINGTDVNLSAYANKKILVVNVASASRYASQLSELETLYQQHKDSLQVIVFPTDSFGNEPLSDSALHRLFSQTLQVHYTVTRKTAVTGSNMHPLYKWLSDATLNSGERSGNITADFQKILIGRDGKIHGHFHSRVNPLHPILQQAILQTGN